jgi:hypothetical protein
MCEAILTLTAAGVGIVGKEGKQASLAADFSVTQFSYLTKLLLWHGRNSYRRSAKLAQFVIHRGLIISVMQAVFSSIFYFAPIALYQGWLMVGYATIYTMAPVFSLVLDRDLNEDLALSYPELYKELTKVRAFSFGICSLCKRPRATAFISGTSLILQDFLHLAHDQSLPRRGNHDHSARSIRERVFEHRCNFIHGVDLERTHHGRIRDYEVVRLVLTY